VEVAARLAVANFAPSDLPPPASGPTTGPPTGTILYQATFGVNWYLNDYARLMADYTLVVPEVRGFPALPVHVFGLRTAVWW
jgi:phosphate-selective porin OprO/OprP